MKSSNDIHFRPELDVQDKLANSAPLLPASRLHRRKMRLAIALLITAACYGQGTLNLTTTGHRDDSGAMVQPPTRTFASPPSSPVTGSVYIFTDSSAVGTCSGGGSALATCRWSGSAWQAGGGAGGSSDASIFSGGAQVLRSIQCASGTTSYTALTAAAANQEITIQTGISGNVRWDQVMVSETTQFAGVNAALEFPKSAD